MKSRMSLSGNIYIICLVLIASSSRGQDYRDVCETIGSGSGYNLSNSTQSSVNNHAPTFNLSLYSANISESAEVNTTVIELMAVDCDEGSFGEFVFSLVNNDVPFTVSSETMRGVGVTQITLTQPLDFEARMIYEFQVVATETASTDAQTGIANVTIHVDDENDESPMFPTALFSASIAENAPPNSYVAQIYASDRDSGLFGTILYSILDVQPPPTGSTSGSFSINETTGVVRSIGTFDRESIAGPYNITIFARDGGVPSNNATSVLAVDILDVNDNSPVFVGTIGMNSIYNFVVIGSPAIGTVVGQVQAVDADEGTLGQVRYFISTAKSSFQVNTLTGEVYTISNISQTGAVTELQVVVIATDLDGNFGQRNTAGAVVIISVRRLDDSINGSISNNGSGDFNGGSGDVDTTDQPPESPGFTDILTTPTTSTLQWLLPQNDSLSSLSWSYVGPCSDSEALSDVGLVQLDGSTRNYTLTDLRPNSEYLVTLETGNNETFQITVNTTIEVPDFAVADLRITAVSLTSAEIAWTPISCLQRYGLPVSTRIVVRELPANRLVDELSYPDIGNYTHRGLQANMEYVFQIFVEYNGSIGANGTEVAVSTAPPQPSFVNVLSSPFSATIQWSHSPADFIVSYNVSWSYVGPCDGAGTPPDGYQFFNDGSRRNVTLASLMPNSQYFVTLVAINSIGAMESSLLVNTTFRAPDVESISVTGVRISEVTESSLRVEWTPVACFQHYTLPVTVRITLSQVSTGLRVGTATVAHDSGDYSFTGLQPGTEYSFQLNVAYESNIGRTGTIIRATTARVPPNSPVLANIDTTSNSTRITWAHSTMSNVQAYTVSWSYVGPCSVPQTRESSSQLLDGSRRSFTLTNLRANSQYLVRVQARNDVGTSTSSVVVNTSYAAPKIQVTNLMAIDVTETSVMLRWTPVDCLQRNNVPIRVKVISRQLPSGNIVGIAIIADEGSFTRTQLEPGFLYSFQVLATGADEPFGESGPIITSNTFETPDGVQCDEDIDDLWLLTWPQTSSGRMFSHPCPAEDTNGLVSRQCLSSGQWSSVNTSFCRRRSFAVLSQESETLFGGGSAPSFASVEMLVSNLTVATSATTTGNSSHFPSDLNTTNAVVTQVVDFLLESSEQADPNELLPFNEELIDVFNNLLEEGNEDGWEQLQMQETSLGSTVLLQNAESYAEYVANAIVDENIDTGDRVVIMLPRTNILLDAVAIPQDSRFIDTVYFPDLEGDKEREFGNAPTQARIPANLLIERGANESNVTAVNVLFSNLEFFLPPIGNKTEAASSIISSQIISQFNKTTTNSFPVEFYFETRMYNRSKYKIENPRCASVIQDEILRTSGKDLWNVDGIQEVSVTLEEDGDFAFYKVICRSFHLTSFAVLLDVNAITQTIPPSEEFALTIVSYIGCSISIIFLLAAIVMLLSLGKELLKSVHYFIHLNLAIALLLAYLLFVTGVDNAVSIRGVCTAVAALLHYLFTAVFCWMLCEGIMLYLMLVVVFSSLAKKWWFFALIGWGLPIFPVVVSVGIMHDQYGSENNCWLAVESASSIVIWLFVGPMLIVILLNTFFLISALRNLYKVRKARQQKGKMKSQARLFWKVFSASVILLPLLGFTWLFGLLAVNNNLTVFAWIFTIFNSLQGLFIFILQVARNDKITKRFREVFMKSGSKSRATATTLRRSTGPSSYVRDRSVKYPSRMLTSSPVSETDTEQGTITLNPVSETEAEQGTIILSPVSETEAEQMVISSPVSAEQELSPVSETEAEQMVISSPVSDKEAEQGMITLSPISETEAEHGLELSNLSV